jgi:hypothetical protein
MNIQWNENLLVELNVCLKINFICRNLDSALAAAVPLLKPEYAKIFVGKERADDQAAQTFLYLKVGVGSAWAGHGSYVIY